MIESVLAALHAHLYRPRWWLAYSGGVDSHVLLHAVARLRDRHSIPPLHAIHINHRLNPRAQDWAEHCLEVCAALGIELRVVAVDVIERGAGLEAAARAARYAAFEQALGVGELLLQAHHRDDQIETLLLRLLRGSGIAGLAAIPAERALGAGLLLRPLLTHTRAELVAYARAQALRWIEDDSNDSERFDRNFLRLRVLPQLAERWPAYRETLARAVDQAGEAAQLLDELAEADLAAAGTGDTLPVGYCLQMRSERLHNLLRRWLRKRNLPQPGREQLLQVVAMMSACADAEPCVRWPGAELHRFRDRLHAFAPLPPLPAQLDQALEPPAAVALAGRGQLHLSAAHGQGLRADRDYRVCNRRSGLRCRPLDRAHSQTLKKLLQEYAVPTWLRDRLPLIFSGDELAAVADLWICEGFQAGPQQPGWVIEWSLPQ